MRLVRALSILSLLLSLAALAGVLALAHRHDKRLDPIEQDRAQAAAGTLEDPPAAYPLTLEQMRK